MGDPVRMVKDIIKKVEESLLKMEAGEALERRHAELTALKDVVKELLAARQMIEPIPADFGDLSDLPDELRGELTVTKVAQLDSQLFTVINAAGGTADLDKILVGLYRKFGVVGKRRAIANKLWRIAQREDGTLWADPDSKGVYTTKDPTITQAERRMEKQIRELPRLPGMPGWDLDATMRDQPRPHELDDEIPF